MKRNRRFGGTSCVEVGIVMAVVLVLAGIIIAKWHWLERFATALSQGGG